MPKVSGRPAIACFFQLPTCVGWTPNVCAICAAVFCDLIVSTATFAFRLGE